MIIEGLQFGLMGGKDTARPIEGYILRGAVGHNGLRRVYSGKHDITDVQRKMSSFIGAF